MKRRLSASDGFSLLELLVAFAIMAMALGMVYRATGGAVRSVTGIEERQRALWLIESVLAQVDGVPEQGLVLEGEAQELRWTLHTAPYVGGSADPGAPRLHEVQVVVHWSDGGQPRQVELTALRPQRVPPTPRSGS